MTYSRMILNNRLRRPLAAAMIGTAVLALAACGQSPGGSASPGSDAGAASTSSPARDRTEVGALTPRITLAHDGGLTVIDSSDGTTLATQTLNGYARLSPAGDGRHVIVAADEQFRALDTGVIQVPHGDHVHHYTQTPALLDAAIPAEHPGHVVAHGERTALFADGSGTATVFDPAHLQEGDFGTLTTLAAPAPHHGVAVPLADGSILRTEGTADARSSVVVQDSAGHEIARTDDCPGVHGEATAQATEQGDVVALGCQNGPVLYRDGAFHKVAPIAGSERSGTLKGSDASPVVLADAESATDDGSSQGTTVVGLLNTRDDSLRAVDLGSPNWFRSLDRGPNGEALVLTGDGELNILDPETGAVLHEVPAVGPWTEPEQWQSAAPMLSVADGTAFVVDPSAKKLVMIDIASGQTYRELDLPVVPHEIQVTTGTASGEVQVAAGQP